MGLSSAQPPQPPGLSFEEKDLLAKQGLTLDQFNQILQQSTVDASQNQDLLRQISGLYKTNKTAAKETINTQAIQRELANSLENSIRSGRIVDPAARARDEQLRQALTDINVARSLGFTTATPESTQHVLDPDAVADLRARIAAEQSTQDKIKQLADQRYINALEGKLPASVGLLQRKETDFKLLKEGAARRGIIIDGENPETAVSQSTAGNELVGQFKRTYGLLEDSERRAEISGGLLSINPGYATPLNLATNSSAAGPAGLLPTYSNLSSQYGGMATPYTNQRTLGYQGQVAAYNAGRQQLGSLTGLLGAGSGYAFMSGNPALGAGLGLLGIGSSFL